MSNRRPMTPRLKKFIGMVILLIGFFFYVVAAITIADYLPSIRLVQLVYFVLAGIAWIFPVKSLLSWMNRETGQDG